MNNCGEYVVEIYVKLWDDTTDMTFLRQLLFIAVETDQMK